MASKLFLEAVVISFNFLQAMVFKQAFQAVVNFGRVRNQKPLGKIATGFMGTLITISCAISALGSTAIATPDLIIYPKSEVQGKNQRKIIEDPLGELKLRNVGGSPMQISSLELFFKGNSINSFQSALGNGKLFTFESEASSFLAGGHKQRSFESKSEIPLTIVRPIESEFKSGSHAWVDEYEKSLLDIKIVVVYRYFPFPFIGYLFSDVVTITPGSSSVKMSGLDRLRKCWA